MDMSSLLGVLLSSDSVSGVSKATKADNNEVASVLNAALPMLLKGPCSLTVRRIPLTSLPS